MSHLLEVDPTSPYLPTQDNRAYKRRRTQRQPNVQSRCRTRPKPSDINSSSKQTVSRTTRWRMDKQVEINASLGVRTAELEDDEFTVSEIQPGQVDFVSTREVEVEHDAHGSTTTATSTSLQITQYIGQATNKQFEPSQPSLTTHLKPELNEDKMGTQNLSSELECIHTVEQGSSNNLNFSESDHFMGLPLSDGSSTDGIKRDLDDDNLHLANIKEVGGIYESDDWCDPLSVEEFDLEDDWFDCKESPSIHDEAEDEGSKPLYEGAPLTLAESTDGVNIYARIAAGITSGGLAVVIAQPTDVVKVRLQAQGMNKESGTQYRGAYHAYKTIFKEEGLKKGLWKGSLPNITRNAVVTASELVSYDMLKEYILKNKILPDEFPCHIVSAFGAGFITTCVASPVDVVKTRFMNSPAGQYAGALNCAAKMFREGGPLAFYKGFLPNFMRLSAWSVVMFVSFEQLKRVMMDYKTRDTN